MTTEQEIIDNDKIVITEWPYNGKDTNSVGFHPNMIYKDQRLSDAISDYYERVLQPKDIELFKQEHNIIATSLKYYGAFFEKDLKPV